MVRNNGKVVYFVVVMTWFSNAIFIQIKILLAACTVNENFDLLEK